MWFNKKSNKSTEDRGWQAMSVLLDKELPENKRKRRLVLWLWPVAASLTGALLYFSINNGLPPQQHKAAAMKPQPVAMNTPASAILLHDQTTSESLPSGKQETIAQKTTSTKIQSNHYAKTTGEANLKAENNRMMPITQTLAETIQQDIAVQNSDITIESTQAEPEITRALAEVNKITALPYNLHYNEAMSEMTPLPLVMKKSGSIGFHPYAVAGLFAPPALDRAGFALGGGIAIQYKKWLGLSLGIQYEKYRGKYDYQNEVASSISDLNSLSAYTDVKQYSVPLLLHVAVPSTPLTVYGGVAKNFVQNTANYYAIPSRSQAELNVPGFDVNSLSYASSAAASIPGTYYEWQLGLRLRMWKKWSIGLLYREQFEKVKNGIVPGFNHLGLNLSYGLQ